MGTFGRLYPLDETNEVMFYTVERPWWWEPDTPAGVPFRSCIPEGKYNVMRTSTPKHKQTFILDSDENWVFHEKQDESSRYGILIHIGNTMYDVVGCIAPGISLGVVRHKKIQCWAVLQSQIAFDQLWGLDLGDEFELNITQVQGADPGGPMP